MDLNCPSDETVVSFRWFSIQNVPDCRCTEGKTGLSKASPLRHALKDAKEFI